MSARIATFWFVCLLIQACFHPVLAQTPTTSPEWKITKTEWSAQDEVNFQSFVTSIGQAIEARLCSNVTQCMNSSANPYRKYDPPGLSYRSDCADFPYFLRGYFAWKNGLPFTLANEMDLRNVPGNDSKDLRYSKFGNVVTGRLSTASVNGKFKSALNILNSEIPNNTWSANFRTHYADSNTDFYPVPVNRNSIRVGTTMYNPSGHVAMVFKVSQDGKVFYIDAHPDNSVTFGTFDPEFKRSNPSHGAGFKNWRPIKLVGAQSTPDGTLINGKIVLATNAEIADYSIEQYFGNSGNKLTDSDWSKGRFTKNGQDVSFYEYVRQSLAIGVLKIKPLEEMKSLLISMCSSLKDRVNSVETAIKAGMDRQSHPQRLPLNIYGSQGEWEEYSTPGRDVKLKNAFNELVMQSASYLKRWKAKDPNLIYTGTNLAKDLLDVYSNGAMACEIVYTNSAKDPVKLNIEVIRQRVFKLSFDPYHCVERRWGAITAIEKSTCQDDADKTKWYEREQRLRNATERQHEHRMDFTLDELLKPLPGNGTDTTIDVDILGFLKSQL